MTNYKDSAVLDESEAILDSLPEGVLDRIFKKLKKSENATSGIGKLGKVYNVSREEMIELSGGDNVGYNTGKEIYMDKTLLQSPEKYQAVLAHERGHYFFKDQAKASEWGTRYLMSEKERAEGDDKEILNRAIDVSQEMGKKFPGFRMAA